MESAKYVLVAIFADDCRNCGSYIINFFPAVKAEYPENNTKGISLVEIHKTSMMKPLPEKDVKGNIIPADLSRYAIWYPSFCIFREDNYLAAQNSPTTVLDGFIFNGDIINKPQRGMAAIYPRTKIVNPNITNLKTWISIVCPKLDENNQTGTGAAAAAAAAASVATAAISPIPVTPKLIAAPTPATPKLNPVRYVSTTIPNRRSYQTVGRINTGRAGISSSSLQK